MYLITCEIDAYSVCDQLAVFAFLISLGKDG